MAWPMLEDSKEHSAQRGARKLSHVPQHQDSDVLLTSTTIPSRSVRQGTNLRGTARLAAGTLVPRRGCLLLGLHKSHPTPPLGKGSYSLLGRSRHTCSWRESRGSLNGEGGEARSEG